VRRERSAFGRNRRRGNLVGIIHHLSLSEAHRPLWFHRRDETSDAWQATRVECDRLGASAEAARFRVQLVSADSDVMLLADSAFFSVDAIHTASDRNEMVEVEKRFERAVKEFIAAAGIQFRLTTP
jgi:hypothetical protein